MSDKYLDSNCPECGESPTDESVVRQNLSDMGYLHEDTRLECAGCGTRWVVGVPQGEAETNKWVCESCGGDLMPHFLFVNLGEQVIETRPKCRDCFHVPEGRVSLEAKFQGENVRGFVGHHSVTGSREDASGDPV